MRKLGPQVHGLNLAPPGDWRMGRRGRFNHAAAGASSSDVSEATAAPVFSPLSIPILIIVVGLFIPEELSFYLLGLRLTVVRLMFLLLSPFLLIKAANKLSAGLYRFVLSDFLVVAAGAWFLIAPAQIDNAASALNHAGPIVLEFCVAYFLTRLMLSEDGAPLSFISALCRGISISALVGGLDPLTNSRFSHDLAARLTAPMHSIDAWTDRYRLGLLRAFGPLEHPILFGFVCVVGLLLALSNPVRGRLFAIISCSIGAFLSLSSAPIQVMIMGLALLTYDRLFSGWRQRWLALAAAILTIVLASFVLSNNPIGFIISHLTFSPESGYYREWTWRHVLAHLSKSPWFGMGFGELPPDINHSIDSLWLVLSIQFGYPGAMLVAFAEMISGPFIAMGSNLSQTEARLATTLGIVNFLIFYLAFTVHFWGVPWILTGLLLGLKANLTEKSMLPEGASVRRAPEIAPRRNDVWSRMNQPRRSMKL